MDTNQPGYQHAGADRGSSRAPGGSPRDLRAYRVKGSAATRAGTVAAPTRTPTAVREIPMGLVLGGILAVLGIGRIVGILKPQFKSKYDSNTVEDYGTVAIKTAAAAN